MQTAELKGFDTDAARILAAQNLSDRQISFIWNYLQGMTKVEAAVASGYGEASASAVFRGAKVQQALALVMDRFLLGELAPMALRTAHQIMGDPKSPAGVRATLALGVLDRAGFSAKRHEKPDLAGRDPSTMSSAELQAEIDKLQRAIDDKMRDITPVGTPTDSQDIEIFR